MPNLSGLAEVLLPIFCPGTACPSIESIKPEKMKVKLIVIGKRTLSVLQKAAVFTDGRAFGSGSTALMKIKSYSIFNLIPVAFAGPAPLYWGQIRGSERPVNSSGRYCWA